MCDRVFDGPSPPPSCRSLLSHTSSLASTMVVAFHSPRILFTFSSCNYFTRGFGGFSDVMIFPSNSWGCPHSVWKRRMGRECDASNAPTQVSSLRSIATPTDAGGVGTSLTTSSVPSTNRRAVQFFFQHWKKKEPERGRECQARQAQALSRPVDQYPYVKRHFLWAFAHPPCACHPLRTTNTFALSVCVIKIDLSPFFVPRCDYNCLTLKKMGCVRTTECAWSIQGWWRTVTRIAAARDRARGSEKYRRVAR